MNSRVTTTQVLAEAIAASDSQPTFLAGNGIGIYGDHGDQPVTEMADSRGDALLTRVSRGVAGRDRARPGAGARVCVLHTAPIHDRRSEPLRALRLLFKAGLGGPIGDGSQYVPMISARDWVDAVIHLAETDSARGSFNLCCEEAPDQRGAHPRAGPPGAPAGVLPRARVRRTARGRADGQRGARLGQLRAGEAAGERLQLQRPRRQGRAARGARPESLIPLTRQVPPSSRNVIVRVTGRLLRNGATSPCSSTSPPATRSKTRSRRDELVAAQHPDREHLRHQPAYDEPARPVGPQQPDVGPAGRRTAARRARAGHRGRLAPRRALGVRPSRAAPRARPRDRCGSRPPTSRAASAGVRLGGRRLGDRRAHREPAEAGPRETACGHPACDGGRRGRLSTGDVPAG